MDQRTTEHGLPTRAILVICCMAQFMVVLDVSIVNVALPQMRDTWAFRGRPAVGGQRLHADLCRSPAAWRTGGRPVRPPPGLHDRAGRLTLCSLIGGLAQSGIWLIAARAAQGVGGPSWPRPP